MYPLDFEEFLWANGISPNIIDKLRQCLNAEEPVPLAIHERMRQLLLQYTIVGGMPKVVNNFVVNHNLATVRTMQRTIVSEYEDDMIKYAMHSDKSKIRECFESIPRQLSKENKKFQYSVIRNGGKASQYLGSLQWIEDAGIITRCRNLSIPELPLEGNAINDTFKVYMQIQVYLPVTQIGRRLNVHCLISFIKKGMAISLPKCCFYRNGSAIAIFNI